MKIYLKILGHLFFSEGKVWRNLRTKLLPAFTNGKMKMMFPGILEVGNELTKVLNKCAKNEESDMKDILIRYTTDVISSIGFGIDTKSLSNPDGSEFLKMARRLDEPTNWESISENVTFACPKLGKFLKVLSMKFHLKPPGAFLLARVCQKLPL